MVGRVIVITGTPSVGKTTVARLLSLRLNAVYVNLTEFAVRENLVVGKDEARGSLIVDEGSVSARIREIVNSAGEKDVIIDGHYAPSVVPNEVATHVFVLRRDPEELQKLMRKAGFSDKKLWENLAAEILDVCLVDALNAYDKEKICELDVSGKDVEVVVAEILEAIKGLRKCRMGVVDWLGKLEMKGKLDEFFKI
ncbi:adenylate kinase family protein [Candidatus Bathyarchaeota archaeon]|nr:adenylate kinase family protein [Candidatus Bathyarchaeota archaeon]